MRANLPSLVLLASALGVCFPVAAPSQPPPDACSALVYSQPEAGAQRYVLDRVEGQVVYASAWKEKDLQNAKGACIALFAEKDRRRIATTTEQDHGGFALKGVAPGRYTLVAAMKGERTLAVPIELAKGSGGPLLLRLRDEGDPGKSLATLVADPGLRQEILQMYEQDQKVRQDMIKSGWDRTDPSLDARMAAIDAHDTARMREIVKQHGGWPGPGLVGVDGTEAAFLLVQHAEHSFQEEMLPLVEKAYRAGELRGEDYALLKDRVLVGEGKPQVYGTQAKFKGKEAVPDPIEDPANLDKRRAEVGLGPFAEYLKGLKEMYFPAEKGKP